MAQEQQNNGLLTMLFRDGKLPTVEVEIDTISLVKLGAALAGAGMFIVLTWYLLKRSLKNG